MVAGEHYMPKSPTSLLCLLLRARNLKEYFAYLFPLQSRPAIKKYIQANNKIPAVSSAAFDSQFNKAIRTGVDKGDFEQPKGMFYICIVMYLRRLCPQCSIISSVCLFSRESVAVRQSSFYCCRQCFSNGRKVHFHIVSIQCFYV